MGLFPRGGVGTPTGGFRKGERKRGWEGTTGEIIIEKKTLWGPDWGSRKEVW